MAKVIKVENLSKAYQLGDFGTGTISRDLERYWARLRGKEDPFLKIGETNDRTTKGGSDIVWALPFFALIIFALAMPGLLAALSATRKPTRTDKFAIAG